MKDKQLSLMETKRELTKSGECCISTRQRLLRLRVLMRNSVSTLTDLSISDLDFQCKELLNAMEQITFGSEDGERIPLPNNGTSMRFQRPLRTTTGNPTHLTFKEMEDQAMLDVQPLIQDGGNYGDLTALSLETSRTTRYSMFKVVLTENKRTLWSTMPTERSINNGTLCTLMNGRVNLKKVNSMKDLVCMSKEISTLSLSFQPNAILI